MKPPFKTILKRQIMLAAICFATALRGFAQEPKPEEAQKSAAQRITNDSIAVQLPEESEGTNDSDAATTHEEDRNGRHGRRISRNALVLIGKNAELKKGETAEAVVVIGGSAKIYGKVRDAVVVIGGDLEVQGEIGEAAVAVMGDVKVGKAARINGEVVSVGGKTDIAEGAAVEGQVQETNFGGDLPRAEWLRSWFSRGLLKLRPLAPGVGWVWVGWCILLLIYLLIATAFPKPVQACMDELTRRPATSFLMGLLTQLLLPLVLIILIVLVIGIIVVPFVLAALVLGYLVGKTAMLQWLGFKFAGPRRRDMVKGPGALLIGAAIITVLYLIPVIGILMFLIISLWGLGSVVMAASGGLRGEMPLKEPLPATSATAPGSGAPPPISPAGTPSPAPAAAAAFEQMHPESPGAASTTSSHAPGAETIPPFVPQMPSSLGATVATVPDAWAFPKATFWERMGAAFLDMVFVGAVTRFMDVIFGHLLNGPHFFFLIAVAYFAGMWAWKSSTIGGVVLGLKVTRLDGQPITFAVGLVRALAAAFSVIVLFLGFLWIIWDKEGQGWHDRIAGTVVVKLPKGTPLICL